METTVDKADLVLHDGSVFGHPESDSVAIAKGEVVAHGRYCDLKALVGPRTHLIPLAGRAVTPGFVDSPSTFHGGRVGRGGPLRYSLPHDRGIARRLARRHRQECTGKLVSRLRLRRGLDPGSPRSDSRRARSGGAEESACGCVIRHCMGRG